LTGVRCLPFTLFVFGGFVGVARCDDKVLVDNINLILMYIAFIWFVLAINDDDVVVVVRRWSHCLSFFVFFSFVVVTAAVVVDDDVVARHFSTIHPLIFDKGTKSKI